jgi:hypothetical protein
MIADALKRSAPSILSMRSKGSLKTDHAEESVQNGASAVHVQAKTALPTTKAVRKKHRGSGKGDTEARQEQPLSLPLVYEHLQAERLEERNGH